MTGVLIRRPCEDTQGSKHMTMETEIKVIQIKVISQGTPRIAGNLKKLGEA